MRFVAVILAIVAVSASGAGVNTAGLSDDETRQFLTELQSAVGSRDSGKVTEMVSFPVLVAFGGTAMRLDKSHFVALYDVIFTEELVEVILEQEYEELFVNYQGVMIGRGAVWYAGICRDAACEVYEVKVITINGV